MKNQIFLLFLLFSICTTYAQHRQQDDTIKRLYLDEYPYANVLEYLNNPDTIFFCHYYPRRTEEKKTPFAISLFVYRKNQEWWATTLYSYVSGNSCKRKYYWKLTNPMWIETDLTPEIASAISELDSLHYGYDISILHTWVYINCGRIITKDLIGNIRDFANIVPKFSYVFTVCFLESSNNNIVKTFRTTVSCRRRSR